ncbi:Xyloglucan:xyloglucosyl transferase [Bertholletia excelsa]
MGVFSSIWNADDWATQGGRVKTDWSHAPFIASYRGFEIDACEFPEAAAFADNTRRCSGGAEKFWWDEPTMAELNVHQSHQLWWTKAHHLIYDYCTDKARFPVAPAECEHHRHL